MNKNLLLGGALVMLLITSLVGVYIFMQFTNNEGLFSDDDSASDDQRQVVTIDTSNSNSVENSDDDMDKDDDMVMADLVTNEHECGDFSTMNSSATLDIESEYPGFELESEDRITVYTKECNDGLDVIMHMALPNSCHDAMVVEAMIQESFPETVVYTIDIEQPEPDIICDQAISNLYIADHMTNVSPLAAVVADILDDNSSDLDED